MQKWKRKVTLQHIVAVIAEHDEFAMRHVDHADRALADGQAQRRAPPYARAADAEPKLVQNRPYVDRSEEIAERHLLALHCHTRFQPKSAGSAR